jgi:hypothetical protein
MRAGDATVFVVDSIAHGSVRRINPGERRIVVYSYSYGQIRHCCASVGPCTGTAITRPSVGLHVMQCPRAASPGRANTSGQPPLRFQRAGLPHTLRTTPLSHSGAGSCSGPWLEPGSAGWRESQQRRVHGLGWGRGCAGTLRGMNGGAGASSGTAGSTQPPADRALLRRLLGGGLDRRLDRGAHASLHNSCSHAVFNTLFSCGPCRWQAQPSAPAARDAGAAMTPLPLGCLVERSALPRRLHPQPQSARRSRPSRPRPPPRRTLPLRARAGRQPRPAGW